MGSVSFAVNSKIAFRSILPHLHNPTAPCHTNIASYSIPLSSRIRIERKPAKQIEAATRIKPKASAALPTSVLSRVRNLRKMRNFWANFTDFEPEINCDKACMLIDLLS